MNSSNIFNLLEMSNGESPNIMDKVTSGASMTVDSTDIDDGILAMFSGAQTVILIVLAIFFVFFAFKIITSVMNNEDGGNQKINMSNVMRNDVIALVVIMGIAAVTFAAF